jgi:fermentation-respiration switch protein FrsA (DUF1100 family)
MQWPLLFKKILILISVSALLTGCSSLLYYPQREILYDPAKVNLKPQDVWIKTEHEDIHAWLFKANKDINKKSKGTFVFFHGNAENLTSHYLSLAWILEYNYDFLIFDYPGYGQSTGEPSPQSTTNSGRYVLQWVHNQLDSRPLYIYGSSLGGIVSLKVIEDVQKEIPIKMVVIDSSFNSYQKVGRRVLSRTWITWLFQPLAYLLLSDKYAPDQLDKLSPIPILFIHGQKDRTVEPAFSEEMFAEAGDPKDIWRIPKGTHGSTFFINRGEYREKLIQFLEK